VKHVAGMQEKFIQGFGEEPQRKRQLRRHSSRFGHNIRKDLKEQDGQMWPELI